MSKPLSKDYRKGFRDGLEVAAASIEMFGRQKRVEGAAKLTTDEVGELLRRIPTPEHER